MVRFLAVVVGLLAVVLLALLFQWTTPATESAAPAAPTVDLRVPYEPDDLPPLRASSSLGASPPGPPVSAAERSLRQPPAFTAHGALGPPVTTAGQADAADARLLDGLLLIAAALSVLLVTAGGYLLGGLLRRSPGTAGGAAADGGEAGSALAGAEAQLEQLRERLAAREAEVASMNRTLEMARADAGDDAPDAHAALDAAQRQVSDIGRQASAVDEELTAMQGRLEEAQARGDEMEAELRRLREAQADAEEGDVGAEELRTTIEQLEHELDEWRALWREAEPRLTRQQKAIIQLEGELDASTDTIRGLRRHIASIQRRLNRARGDEELKSAEDDFPGDDVDTWINELKKDEPE